MQCVIKHKSHLFYAHFKCIIFYIYIYISSYTFTYWIYWIIMQTLYAFYIHVLHPLGGSPI